MENYEKEPTHIEHIVESNPFDDPQFFHIEVLKDKSLMGMANRGLKNFGPGKPLVFYAEGRAVPKAVSCAEIIKSYHKKPIHQITHVNQMKTLETWEPVAELAEELDPLIVTRSVPMIYILMSLEPLDSTSKGYQKSHFKQQKRIITMSELSNALADELIIPSSPPAQTTKDRESNNNNKS